MKKINYSAYISNLIALCHIIDEFEEFQNELIPILSSKNSSDFIYTLSAVSKGTTKLGATKEKNFYTKNKYIIDKINQHSHLISFIDFNYGRNGMPYDNFQFFYQYILKHRNKLRKILGVLLKLKQLGFEKIDFNSDLDFTQETYKIHTFFSNNFNITYFDNLTAIPSYNSDTISYKTNGSKYKITVGISLGRISKYDKHIVLNNLIFDYTELPSAISKEEIFYKIIGLRQEKQHEYSLVSNSVDLGVSVSDLYDMYNSVSSKINNLENVEKKEELVQLLQTIKETILKMQTISTEYDKNIAEKNPTISEKFLEEQKKAYIRRRENSKLHID